MMEKKELKSPARRAFFKKTGYGLGAAGVAAAGLASGTAQAETKPDKGHARASYRVTDHVRRVYDLAKF